LILTNIILLKLFKIKKNNRSPVFEPQCSGVIPLEFHIDLWWQKTRFPALSYGTIWVILS